MNASVSEQGTYTTSGSALTLTPSNGSPSDGAYCVQGGSLHLLGLDSQMRPVSDQVARRP